MQGKGGVGKSFVAYNLAQYLRAADPETLCIDTDPLTPTLSRFQALGATYIQIADHTTVSLHHFDEMIEKIINTTSDVVIDTGSSTFLPITTYMLAHEIFELIHESYGKRILVHIVLSAKTHNDFISTTNCLESIAASFPGFVDLVVWLNEFGGEIAGFKELKVYHEIKSRLLAVIKVKNPDELALRDISAMQNAYMTYEEALACDSFRVVSRSRLFRYRKSIWDQLAALFQCGEVSLPGERA